MKCTDIYCRVEARERLKKEGYSERDAKNISDEAFGIIKRVMENNGSQK